MPDVPIYGVDPDEVEGLMQRAAERERKERADALQRDIDGLKWTRIGGWVSILALVIAILALWISLQPG